MTSEHSPLELLVALLFTSAILFYLGREIHKVRTSKSMEINQPPLPRVLGVRQVCQLLWWLGLYPNQRVEISGQDRPFLYRFLYAMLYFVFLSFSVGFLMIFVQLIQALGI